MGARHTSPIFIGRSGELARLEAALADAIAGRPRIMLVAGDAGTGKTRLVAELIARGRDTDARVLAGACLELAGGGLPYAPLVEALRRLVREVDADELAGLLGPARPELARLLPDLAASDDTPARPLEAAAGPAARARLFELLLGLFDRLARTRPVILVIEDVHWIDGASRDLLTFLARNLTTERLLVLATLRTDELERGHPLLGHLAELERAGRVERLTLAPLGRREVGDLLGAIVGERPPDRLVERIAERSGGNPFFAEELLAAATGGDGRRLPPTLREALLARIYTLAPTTRTVLGVAALAGREFDERLLAAVAEIDEPAVLEAIRDAIGRHVLIEDPTGDGYDFRHAVVAEVVHDDLLPGERRRGHARFAEVLRAHPELADRSPAGAAGELAHHWAEADRPAQALTASIEAARAATAVYAHAEAQRQLERALRLWKAVPARDRPTGVDRLGLVLDAEEAANLAGDFDRALELVLDGLAQVDATRDPARAGLLHSRLGYLRWQMGDGHAALEAHRRAAELVPPEPPSRERARVLRALGGALMGEGHYREAIPVCEEAIECARLADAAIEEGRALNMLGTSLLGLGEVEDGLVRLREAATIAERIDDVDGQISALHNLALHLGMAGRLEDSVATALRAVDVAQRRGLRRRYGATTHGLAADGLFRLGRWTDAERQIADATEIELGPVERLFLESVRARILAARGRPTDAAAALASAGALATADMDYDLLAYLRIVEAEAALADARLDDARAAVTAGIGILEAVDDVAIVGNLAVIGLRAAADLADRGRAWGVAEDVTAAQALADRLVRLAGRRMAPGTGDAVVRAVAAETARLEGRHEPATWAAAAAAWDDVPEPLSGAYAQFRRAEAALLAREPRETALAALRPALATADTLGAEPLRSEIVALARRARLDLDPGEAPTPAEPSSAGGPPAVGSGRADEPEADGRRRLAELGLSAREVEVLELVAAGRTNGQIARELFISPKTAGVHVTHILDKLGVGNRVEAATIAARLGIPGPPGDDRPAATPDRDHDRVRRTFMFTDIVGSTGLLEAIGDEAWLDLRRWHDDTLRGLFRRFGGEEVDHAGDGFFVAFPSAAAAIGCAVAIQRALADHRRGQGFAPLVRIGLHTADASRAGSGYAGRAVHLAARLAAAAGGGEIVASRETLDEGRVSAPAGTAPIKVSGIAQPVDAGAVEWRAGRT